jgi:hypothetical protein
MSSHSHRVYIEFTSTLHHVHRMRASARVSAPRAGPDAESRSRALHPREAATAGRGTARGAVLVWSGTPEPAAPRPPQAQSGLSMGLSMGMGLISSVLVAVALLERQTA